MGRDSFDDIAKQLLGDRDSDDDGVFDFNDCQPFNEDKQDAKEWFKGMGKMAKGAVETLSNPKKLKEKAKDVRQGYKAIGYRRSGSGYVLVLVRQDGVQKTIKPGYKKISSESEAAEQARGWALDKGLDYRGYITSRG